MGTATAKNQSGVCDSAQARDGKQVGKRKQNGRPPKLVTYKGETKTVDEWSALTGVTSAAINYRLSINVPEDMLFVNGRLKRDTYSDRDDTIKLTHGDRTMSIRQWSEYLGISIGTLRTRLRNGLSPKHIFSKDKLPTGVPSGYFFNKRKPRDPNTVNAMRIEYNGKKLTIRQWAQELGISQCTIRSRYNLGMPLEQVFDTSKSGIPRKSLKDVAKVRCFVCNEMIAPRVVDKGNYVIHTRFKKAHHKCYKDWQRIQQELTGQRKKLKDLDG